VLRKRRVAIAIIFHSYLYIRVQQQRTHIIKKGATGENKKIREIKTKVLDLIVSCCWCKHTRHPLSKAALSRLPVTTVKDGNIIAPRNKLSSYLHVDDSVCIVVRCVVVYNNSSLYSSCTLSTALTDLSCRISGET
jgi:hypothetical protein